MPAQVRALEEAGFIEGYTALISQQKKRGMPRQRVRETSRSNPPRKSRRTCNAFEEGRTQRCRRSWSCYLMSGESTFIYGASCSRTPPISSALHSQPSHPAAATWRGCSPEFAAGGTVQKSRELAGALSRHPPPASDFGA